MKRKNNVSIYMTDEEKAVVERAAKAEGFTLALFVRRAALREAEQVNARTKAK
jgi:uncharacterized protein (DUF1778 family)